MADLPDFAAYTQGITGPHKRHAVLVLSHHTSGGINAANGNFAALHQLVVKGLRIHGKKIEPFIVVAEKTGDSRMKLSPLEGRKAQATYFPSLFKYCLYIQLFVLPPFSVPGCGRTPSA
jgi:hypothetical protein